MSPLFGTQYDDETIASTVNRVLISEPRIDATAIQPAIEDGVITLHGNVPNDILRERAIDAIRTGLETSAVDYERIEDKLNTG